MEVDPTKEELSKLTAEIMHSMSLLQHDQVEAVVLETCTKLVLHLSAAIKEALVTDMPRVQIEAYRTINEKYMPQKTTVIRQHGVIPVLEIIDAASDSTALRILQLLNLVCTTASRPRPCTANLFLPSSLVQIIEGNVEIQQNLCMMGGIPSIIKVACALSLCSFLLWLSKATRPVFRGGAPRRSAGRGGSFRPGDVLRTQRGHSAHVHRVPRSPRARQLRRRQLPLSAAPRCHRYRCRAPGLLGSLRR